MADSDNTSNHPDWTDGFESLNEAYFRAVAQTIDTQTEFVDRWVDAIEDSVPDDHEEMTAGVEAYARAYHVWMQAAETQLDRMHDAFEGEPVDPREFRDTWLETANEAFKEVVETTAFAAATGDTVEQVLAFQQQVDEATDETLHRIGFATSEDLEEVGDRLVELERRQHSIEQKLDEIIASLDDD